MPKRKMRPLAQITPGLLPATQQALLSLGDKLLAEGRPMTAAEWAEFRKLGRLIKTIKARKREKRIRRLRSQQGLFGPG